MLPLLFHLIACDSSAYWQQHVAYGIVARLDEPSGVLTGQARILYINHSPDTLHDFFAASASQRVPARLPLGRGRQQSKDAAGSTTCRTLTTPSSTCAAARIMGAAVQPDYPFAPD